FHSSHSDLNGPDFNSLRTPDRANQSRMGWLCPGTGWRNSGSPRSEESDVHQRHRMSVQCRAYDDLGLRRCELTGSVAMPIPPWFSDLAAVLTDNPVIVFLMIIGIFLNAIQIVFNVIIGWTRVSVAMSIDGALPKFVSSVSERTHTPVVAHVIFLVLGGVVMSYVYNFVPGFVGYTLSVTAVATVMYIGTAVGGAIFPWSRKEVYETSPIAKYK